MQGGAKGMRELNWFSTSKDIIDYVDNTYEAMRELYLQHEHSYAKCREEAERRIVTTKYGVGTKGEVHRGCYTPSPLFDVLVGNCSRGRPAKRPGKRSCFRYGFDENEQIVSSEYLYQLRPVFWEGIVNKSDYTLGLCYGLEQQSLQRVTEEFYQEAKLAGINHYQPYKNHALIMERYWYSDHALDRMLFLIVHAFRLSLARDGEEKEAWIIKIGGQWCDDFQMNENKLCRYRSQMFDLCQTMTDDATELQENTYEPCECALKNPREISYAPGRPNRYE